jgi:hypothetical protein
MVPINSDLPFGTDKNGRDKTAKIDSDSNHI